MAKKKEVKSKFESKTKIVLSDNEIRDILNVQKQLLNTGKILQIIRFSFK